MVCTLFFDKIKERCVNYIMAKKLNANNFEKTVKKVYKTKKINVTDVTGEEYELVIDVEAQPTKINQMVNEAADIIVGLSEEVSNGTSDVDLTEEIMDANIAILCNGMMFKYMTNMEGFDREFETSDEKFRFYCDIIKYLDDLKVFDDIMSNFSDAFKEELIVRFNNDLGENLKLRLAMIQSQLSLANEKLEELTGLGVVESEGNI